MIRSIEFYRLQKGQTIHLRDIFNLQNEQVKLIIIRLHNNYPEGLVECTIVGQEEGVCIDKSHAFFWNYGHITSDLNVRTELVDCNIIALEDSVISVSVELK